MTFTTGTIQKLADTLGVVSGRLVYYFSLYAIPLAVLLFSGLAVTTLTDLYPNKKGQPLQFRVLADELPLQNPAIALTALRSSALSSTATTASASWFLVDVPYAPELGETALEFPSRFLQTLSCWNASTMMSYGSADRTQTGGSIRWSRQGYALMLAKTPLPASILCHASFAQESVLSMNLWASPDLRTAASRFTRSVSMLEGGLLTIALFILVIAITNREWVFLLLATWMVGNLRLGALAMGWDDRWLGHSIPWEWMPYIRQVTIAAYYLLTYTLFTEIFRGRGGLGFPVLLRIARSGGLVLLAGALLLPYPWFQPLMWAVCAYGITLAVILLAWTVYTTRSRVWVWHIVSLSTALCVMLSGILLAVFGRSSFIDIFNGVIALLLANVLVALAVAERMREERRERVRAQTELISTYAVIPIAMFTLDNNQAFQRINPVLEQMLGFSLDGKMVHWTDYFEPVDWHEIAEKTKAGEEVEIKLRDGISTKGPRHFAVRAALAQGSIEGSLQDVTARRITIDQLQRMAHNDPLTDVLNRRGIENVLNKSIQQLAEGQPCALAYLDLDHFKRINGMFGHVTGDEVIKEVCQRIKSVLSQEQHVGRIGGDEFIVLLPNTRAAEARTLAVKIIEELNSTTFQVGSRAFQVKSAIGVVELNANMTGQDAISAASHACRDARKQRQEVVVYEQDSHELFAHAEELRLFDQLEGGDSPRGLYLEMQPIMSLRYPLESLNFEVLLRVQDSSGSLIPSGKIIASAEESGTITIIDKWVFSATLEWLARYEKRLAITQFISINLSGVSLNDDKFVDGFFATLAKYEHLTTRLCVEITEGVALQDLERTRSFTTRLQKMGARIALDDFGAGYTSFSYLKELRADAIKIDGALIKDMLANETNTAIVRTIVELARNLGMDSIAEWVEDTATLEALQDMGVDYAQGFVVSKARAPIDVLNALTIADLVMSPETLAFINDTAAKQVSAR